MPAKGLWRESSYRGMRSVFGENDLLRVEVVPERGSKLVSFLNKRTGKQWAYRNEAPWLPLRYGMIFEDGDRSGWDEMFPTILACPCPDEPWSRAAYPDHGEVWTLPWRCEMGEEAVSLTVHGVQVPYILRKTYSIFGGDLLIRYELENPTPFAFSYLWSAHFLLSIRPGMRVETDPQLNSVQYQYSHTQRMTPTSYGRSTYPHARGKDGEMVDLSIVEPNEGQHAEKFWFEATSVSGYTAVVDPETGDRLSYSYSPEAVPYLAVWANYGVFTNDYTLALEPSTGYLDDVYMAKVMRKVKQAPPYGKCSWEFTVSIGIND